VVVGRQSEWALYNEDLASFDSKTYDQSESTGIVKAHGMQSRLYWQLKSGMCVSHMSPTGVSPMAAVGGGAE
jgi:argininosuccinate synthase